MSVSRMCRTAILSAAATIALLTLAAPQVAASERAGYRPDPAPGTVSRAFVSSVGTFANDWCRKNTVRVTGDGYVLDVDARKYYASTISLSIKNPCSL